MNPETEHDPILDALPKGRIERGTQYYLHILHEWPACSSFQSGQDCNCDPTMQYIPLPEEWIDEVTVR